MLTYGMAIATAALSSGCQNSINTVEPELKSGNFTEISDVRFQTDRFLASRLKLVRVNSVVNDQNLLQAQVTVYNDRVGFWSELWSSLTGENPYHVAYRFNWLDQNGMEVHAPSNVWQHRQLIPGQTAYFQAVAPRPNCSDFVLSVREVD